MRDRREHVTTTACLRERRILAAAICTRGGKHIKSVKVNLEATPRAESAQLVISMTLSRAFALAPPYKPAAPEKKRQPRGRAAR